jgi:hypothetical protein
MSDFLERYIRQHRERLDSYEPDDLMWERIDRELRPRKTMYRKWKGWAVAATVALLGLSLGWPQLQGLWGEAPQASGSLSQTVVEEAYTPELSEIEDYYQSVIQDQQNQLVSYRQQGLTLEEPASSSLSQLQKMYKDLQLELAYGEDKEAVVNAMVENLMMQMELLRQQLMILDQIKSQQNEMEPEIQL